MKLLAVCESPPTLDARDGNGSTLISANLLQRLADDVELDLVWFADRSAAPEPQVVARARSTRALPIRSARLGLLAHLPTTKSRGCWQRASRTALATVAEQAKTADVVYFHGFHTFEFASRCDRPVVVHEVDPWSSYWRQRAAAGGVIRGVYDRIQAVRAADLEARVAARAAAYIVVSPDDAEALSGRFGRDVIAMPNGVAEPAISLSPSPSSPVANRLVFAGSLDYPPNIDAARLLCRSVLPLVRDAIPDVSVVVAGRRPANEVLELAGPGVEVRADVPDLGAVFDEAALAVYPGALGHGTKNSLLLALQRGVPVVAVPGAARGVARAGDSHVAMASLDQLPALVVELLRDASRRDALARRGADYASSLPTWDDVARHFSDVLRRAVAQHVEPGSAR